MSRRLGLDRRREIGEPVFLGGRAAGFITFGSKIPVVNDSERKAYFEKDSATSAAIANEVKMDSVKVKE